MCKRVIDCSKPENYVLQWTWREEKNLTPLEILGIYEQDKDCYLVVFKTIEGKVRSASANESVHILDKPVWEPEVGKWYMFSNGAHDVGTSNGTCLPLLSVEEERKYPYGTDSINFKYCWAIPKECVGE